MEFSERTGQFYRGDLHRGESIESEASIVIIGDVRHGARVAAKGNIIVLGELRGSVHAGVSREQGSCGGRPWKWCLFKSGLPIFPVIMVTKERNWAREPMNCFCRKL